VVCGGQPGTPIATTAGSLFFKDGQVATTAADQGVGVFTITTGGRRDH